MAYHSNNRQRRNHHHRQVYERSPASDYQDYEYEGVGEAEARRSHYSPRSHQVGLKSNKEEGVAEVEASSLAETERALDRLRHRAHNSNEDVDQEAETFIQLEHRRICLTKLMSMRPF
ncbi:uncharacterized protein LOC129320723 [Prosopis cineraria]|uniref:uncharacterized protein LOC129320723 n=1 Tax=Prosopis cineraria TaxID=364024 RepID=UPI00240FE69D|nr:uncharacterized protein LOC129320723 [Prosopis cineraria]